MMFLEQIKSRCPKCGNKLVVIAPYVSQCVDCCVVIERYVPKYEANPDRWSEELTGR